jgi:transcriptional regulator with XRE-family HTH domain
MIITEKIRILCAKLNISQAELARRIGKSPQCFAAKMKRATFTIDELNEIANVLGVEFICSFSCPDGTNI